MKKQKTEIPHDILDLLGWKDITTSRQYRNGTRIFELPIKKYGQYIKVGSFRSGYVRRMNGGYTPYQLNKCEPNTEYHKEYKWVPNLQKSVETGKYTKYEGKKRILIPDEIDRIDHLITYCLKNYYINGANEVKDKRYTWSGGQITDNETGSIYVHEQHAYWNKIPNSVQVIVDGHRYNVK